MKSDRQIHVEECSPELLAGLAQLIRLPGQATLGPQGVPSPVEFFGELGVVECAGEFEIGICSYWRRPFQVEQMEQHLGTQELLVAIDDDFLMPIAPSAGPSRAGAGAAPVRAGGAPGPEAVPDPSRLIAVRVHRGEGLVFGRGVWHWAPYPLRQNSFALVGFLRGTAKNDMTVRSLGERVELCT